jgi:hypothetical protein
MIKKPLAMHVVTNHKTVGDKVYRSHLLCHGYREDGKVKKRTLANLSRLPDRVIELIRLALKSEGAQPRKPGEALLKEGAEDSHLGLAPGFPPLAKDLAKDLGKDHLPHGQVMLMLKAMQELGLDEIIRLKISEKIRKMTPDEFNNYIRNNAQEATEKYGLTSVNL